jgi:hypothetical protein
MTEFQNLAEIKNSGGVNRAPETETLPASIEIL